MYQTVLALLTVAFTVWSLAPKAAFAVNVGERVWVDLEAADPSQDGYAEGVVIGKRRGLIEVQASRVDMPVDQEFAVLLRRGPTHIPEDLVKSAEQGRRDWGSKQQVIEAFRSADKSSFPPASPQAQSAIALAALPGLKGRLKPMEALLQFQLAMAAEMTDEQRRYIEGNWSAATNSNAADAVAFAMAAPSLLKKATDAQLRLGGFAALDPKDDVRSLLRLPDWPKPSSEYEAPPIAKRLFHLIRRATQASVDAAAGAPPETVAALMQRTPELARALESLHPDAIWTVDAPADAPARRQKFVEKARNALADAAKKTIEQEPELAQLAADVVTGKPGAIDAWLAAAIDRARPVSQVLGRPLFAGEDRERAARAAEAAAAKRADEAARAAAIAALAPRLTGRWAGTFACAAGASSIELEIASIDPGGAVAGVLAFEVSGHRVRIALQGRIDPKAARHLLRTGAWIDPPPAGRNAAVLGVDVAPSESGRTLAVSPLGGGDCRPATFGPADEVRKARAAAVTTLGPALAGTWSGTVTCNGQATRAQLEIAAPDANGGIAAVLSYMSGGDIAKARYGGRLDETSSGEVSLTPLAWIFQPFNENTTTLPRIALRTAGLGQGDARRTIEGRLINDQCQPFRFTRAN